MWNDEEQRYTTNYKWSYEKSLGERRFKSNRKLRAPEGVDRFYGELGVPPEDGGTPYGREIYAAGQKSDLFKKALRDESEERLKRRQESKMQSWIDA